MQRPRGKDGEDQGADYVDVTVFGRQAADLRAVPRARAARSPSTATCTTPSGTAEDGRRQKLEVIADNVEFLDAQAQRRPATRTRADGRVNRGVERHAGW